MSAIWIVSLLLAFCFGVLVGLYFSSHSVSTAKHRQPISPRPVLMPPTKAEDTPTKSYVDQGTQPWELPPEDLEEFKRGLKEAEGQPANRLQFLREYHDTHSTAEAMKDGHWEGLSGSLEPEYQPKVLRPEETSSSLLGLAQGDIRPTGTVKPVFGETEHLKYDPEDYEEPLICQPCQRALIKGETFWAVSLPEEGDGVFIPICDDCEAKSHG